MQGNRCPEDMNSLVLIDRIVGEMLTESQFYEAWRKKTAAGAEQGEVCVLRAPDLQEHLQSVPTAGAEWVSAFIDFL